MRPAMVLSFVAAQPNGAGYSSPGSGGVGGRAPKVRVLADKNFELLKADARHGSLHLKKIAADVYSVRVGLEYRALAFDRGTHLTWFWIGPHDEYERLIS